MTQHIAVEIFSSEPLLARLLDLNTMTLATCETDGSPHAAAVYFAASRELELYFFSAPDSSHGEALMRDPRAAAAVYPQDSDWRTIQGLQIHGLVAEIEPGTSWEHGWQVFTNKFPFVRGLRQIVELNRLYCLTPHWLRLVDNRKGFGFKQEWRLHP